MRSILGLILMILCCQIEVYSQDLTAQFEHPIQDSIPHYHEDHHLVGDNPPVDHREEIPGQVLALRNYLENSNAIDTQDIEVLVNNASDFDVVAVEESRLVLLDGVENRLIEYDLTTDESTVLAVEGEGPGDLQFSEDMAYSGSMIYVARQDQRITLFDCEPSPCQFDREIGRLDFSALSIAPVSDTTLAVVGEIPLRGPGSDPTLEEDSDPVRIVNREGTVQHAVGDVYRSENWLIRRQFMRSSIVQYCDELDYFLVAFGILPYVYKYDSKGEFVHSYRLEKYEQYIVLEDEEGRAGRRPQERTRITNMDCIENDKLIVEANTINERFEERESVHYSEENKYYMIDLEDEKSYYIGNIKTNETEWMPFIFLTKEGMVINKAGEISFTSY